MYGNETRSALGKHIQPLHVTNMKMLRWMCGVTQLDRVRNERIRGSLGVRVIAGKLQERDAGLQTMSAPDLYTQGQKSRGKTKKRWLDVVVKADTKGGTISHKRTRETGQSGRD